MIYESIRSVGYDSTAELPGTVPCVWRTFCCWGKVHAWSTFVTGAFCLIHRRFQMVNNVGSEYEMHRSVASASRLFDWCAVFYFLLSIVSTTVASKAVRWCVKCAHASRRRSSCVSLSNPARVNEPTSELANVG